MVSSAARRDTINNISVRLKMKSAIPLVRMWGQDRRPEVEMSFSIENQQQHNIIMPLTQCPPRMDGGKRLGQKPIWTWKTCGKSFSWLWSSSSSWYPCISVFISEAAVWKTNQPGWYTDPSPNNHQEIYCLSSVGGVHESYQMAT